MRMGTPVTVRYKRSAYDGWILTSRHKRGKAGLLIIYEAEICPVRGADAVLAYCDGPILTSRHSILLGMPMLQQC